MGIGTQTLDAVAASLIAAGIGQQSASKDDWFIYVGLMGDSSPAVGGAPSPTPVTGDRAICLYETPGRPPLEGYAIDYPGLQVVVRGRANDYTAARNQIQDIFNQLHANETPLGPGFVYMYATQSGPLSMGFDEKKRPKLAWNFRSMRNTPA